MHRANTIAKYMYGPNRELKKKKNRETLFDMYQLTTWMYMYFARVFTIRMAGKVCLDMDVSLGVINQKPGW